jgi:hypothetical protein
MRNCLLIVLLFISTLTQAQKRRSAGSDIAIDARHLVSFSPICGIVAYDRFNPGFGLEYEYIVSKEAGIGIRVPFAFGYNGPDDAFVVYNGNAVSYRHTSLYAAPGVRFHAPIRRGAGEFATGPGIILGNMHFSPYDYYGSTGGALPASYDYGMTGIMADNSLNFYRGHFMFGFDVRVGYLFEVQNDTRYFMHFGIHFGGKF